LLVINVINKIHRVKFLSKIFFWLNFIILLSDFWLIRIFFSFRNQMINKKKIMLYKYNIKVDVYLYHHFFLHKLNNTNYVPWAYLNWQDNTLYMQGIGISLIHLKGKISSRYMTKTNNTNFKILYSHQLFFTSPVRVTHLPIYKY
jgi:hypothetical protein